MSHVIRAIMIGVASIGLVACVQVPSRDMRQMPSASTSVNPSDAAEALFREHLIHCALPLLTKHGHPGMTVAYRYKNGDTHIDVDDPALSEPLRRCATPETGPRQAFSGKLTIWRKAPLETSTYQEERQR